MVKVSGTTDREDDIARLAVTTNWVQNVLLRVNR